MTQPGPDSPADLSGKPIASAGPGTRLRAVWAGLEHFWEQWRQGYLLLTAAFTLTWKVAAVPIPILDENRIMAGLHPFPVLLLMNVLGMMWVPPLAAAILYAASFAFPRLNTAGAVALSGLCAVPVLAAILTLALLCFCFF